MNRRKIQLERWTDHDDFIRAALSDPPGAASDACLEPDDLLELAEQGGKHPRADVLLRHVLDCANCKNEFQQMRKTVALADKARELQHLAPIPWMARLRTALQPQRKLVPAMGLAVVVLIIAIAILRPHPAGITAQPDGLPSDLAAKVQTAIDTGQVELARLDVMTPVTRGSGGPQIESPDQTRVSSADLQLRWREYESAVSYNVSVTSAAGDPVAAGLSITQTQWTVPKGKLQPGKAYRWIVTAVQPGGRSVASDTAVFRVATLEETALLDRAKQAHAGDRLFAGALEAVMGFFDDAEADLKAVPTADTRRPKAVKLLESILELRPKELP